MLGAQPQSLALPSVTMYHSLQAMLETTEATIMQKVLQEKEF